LLSPLILPIFCNLFTKTAKRRGFVRKLTHDEISRQRVAAGALQNARRNPIFGVLDNIRSLYNVGSIFRSSDGGLIRGLYLCGFTPHPPRKEIEKTALGATDTVPWRYFADPLEAVDNLRRQGVRVCVLELTSSGVPYYRVKQSDFPVALIVGNEINGVSSRVVAAADMALEIPMYGTKQSLNAAVAYGIALFGLVKIWNEG